MLWKMFRHAEYPQRKSSGQVLFGPFREEVHESIALPPVVLLTNKYRKPDMYFMIYNFMQHQLGYAEVFSDSAYGKQSHTLQNSSSTCHVHAYSSSRQAACQRGERKSHPDFAI
jgi:hypothetical protein